VDGLPPVYGLREFERRVRVPTPVFLRIYHAIEDRPFWVQSVNATGRPQAHPLQKQVAAFRVLGYWESCDHADEYARLSSSTISRAMTLFTEFIVDEFSPRYLRPPTTAGIVILVVNVLPNRSALDLVDLTWPKGQAKSPRCQKQLFCSSDGSKRSPEKPASPHSPTRLHCPRHGDEMEPASPHSSPRSHCPRHGEERHPARSYKGTAYHTQKLRLVSACARDCLLIFLIQCACHYCRGFLSDWLAVVRPALPALRSPHSCSAKSGHSMTARHGPIARLEDFRIPIGRAMPKDA